MWLTVTQPVRFFGLPLFIVGMLLSQHPAIGQIDVAHGNSLEFETNSEYFPMENQDELLFTGVLMSHAPEEVSSEGLDSNLCDGGRRQLTGANAGLVEKTFPQGQFPKSYRSRQGSEVSGSSENSPCFNATKLDGDKLKPNRQMKSGICDRTQEIVDAILRQIPNVSSCSDVTSSHLASITGYMQLHNLGISSLKEGDFNGLILLDSLYLTSNGLTTLPEGIFADLTSLRILGLAQNGLTELPAGVFADLLLLKRLDLYGNYLDNLPEGLFDSLKSLTSISLGLNQLTTLQPDIFSKSTFLASIDLGNNKFTTLPPGVFDGLNQLTHLDIRNTFTLSSLPAGIFDELTMLESLSLNSNKLSTLPTGIFANLTAIRLLRLDDNLLTSLPPSSFDGLTSLKTLYLNGNQLSTLPAGIFDDLDSLRTLYLSGNRLSMLAADLFDSLTQLNLLRLSFNELTTLPSGIFDHQRSLTRLYIIRNEMTVLPAGVFDKMTSLIGLFLNYNKLTALPENLFEKLTEISLVGPSSADGLVLKSNPGVPFKPSVNAGEDLSVRLGFEVSIQANVTGPWGDLVRWEWVQVDGPSSLIPVADGIRLTGSGTGSPSFTAPMEESDLHFKVVAIPGNIGEATERFGHANSDPDWITIRVRTDTNISDPSSIVDFALLGNYPNPFTSSTTIQLDLPHRANISVDVFNILGQKVHQEKFWGIPAGASRSLSLEVFNLPSGVYVYQMTAEMGEIIQRTEGRMTHIN